MTLALLLFVFVIVAGSATVGYVLGRIHGEREAERETKRKAAGK